MFKCLLLAFVLGAFALTEHNANIINRINAIPGNTWKAGINKFADWTPEQKRAILTVDIPAHEIDMAPDTPANLPDTFSYGDKWPTCVGPVRDQAQCGSCWAFALSEVLSDRFCIAGCPSGMLSPQDLVSCDYLDSGCDGGSLSSSWSWAKSKGLATDKCIPYTSQSGSVAACPTKCVDGSAITRYKAKSYSHISAANMQNEIYTNGPIEVAFDVYEDFFHYSSGVYKHVSGSYEGGHAVVAVGWGVEKDGTKYWLIQNSWGTTWGMKGFFKILRGTDECGIESMAYAGPAQC